MPGWLFSKFGPIFGRGGPMFGQKTCKCCKAICPRCAQRSTTFSGRFYQRGNWQLGTICLCSPRGLTGTVAGITPTLAATGVPVVDRFGNPAGADLSVATDPNGAYCLTVGSIWEPYFYYLYGFKCATGTITVNDETAPLYGYYEVGLVIVPDTNELPPGPFPNTSDPGLINVRVEQAGVGLTMFSDIAARVPNEPTLSGYFLENAPGFKSDGGASTNYLGQSIGTVRAKLISGRSGTSFDDWVWWERQNGWCAPSPDWASFSITNDLTSVPANRLGGTGGTVTVSGPCRTDCGNVNAICLPGVTAMCVEIFETTSSGSPAITEWAAWTRVSGPTVVTISSTDTSGLPPPPWNTVTIGPKTGGGCTARFVRVRPANSSGGCDPLDPPPALTETTPCPYGGDVGCPTGDCYGTSWYWTNAGTGIPHWVMSGTPSAQACGDSDPRTIYTPGGDPWQGQSGSSWSAFKTVCSTGDPTVEPNPPSGYDKYVFSVGCEEGGDNEVSGSRVGDMGVPSTGDVDWHITGTDFGVTTYEKTMFVPTGSLKPDPGSPC